jgi:hypothetical protein
VGKPHAYDSGIVQLDQLDSFTVSVRVEGVLICAGRPDSRITFAPQYGLGPQCEWYGVVLDGVVGDEAELAFTDITGSCHGLYVRTGAPVVHHSVFEYNNVGATLIRDARPKFINCVIAYNLTSGLRISRANPEIFNNLIVFNRLNGMWCDGVSHVTFENNCVFGNADSDLSGCDPLLGVLTKVNNRGDSVDAWYNLYRDPVFAGTRAESLAVQQDPSIAPSRSQVADTAMAKVLYGAVSDTLPFQRPSSSSARRFKLSPLSPCVDAGRKGKLYNDADGTRNDIGLYGGPEFYRFGQ